MNEPKQLKTADLDYQLDSGGIENTVEIPIDDNSSFVYEAKVDHIVIDSEGLIGRSRLEKYLKEIIVKTSRIRGTQTPKIKRTKIWSLFGYDSSGALLTNKDTPVTLNEDGISSDVRNYKICLVNAGLRHSVKVKRHDYENKPVILPKALLEEIFEPIDKQLVEMYKTLLK